MVKNQGENLSQQGCKEKLNYCMSTLGLVLSVSVRSASENYGDEGIQRLRRTFRQAGVELGKNEVKRLKIENRDAKAYHRIVEEALKTFDIKYETVKLSETDYVLRIYGCPHAKNFTSPEVCDVFLELDKGIVEGLNPNIEFELTKHILRGDPYCEYVVKPKKTKF